MSKLTTLCIALAFFFVSCHKDKLSSFEKPFEGKWVSVAYTIDGTDYSTKYQADITFSKNGEFVLNYQWQPGSFDYVLYYLQTGTWQGNETTQSLEFDQLKGSWSGVTAQMQSDSLFFSGLLSGRNAAIIFVRE